MSANVIHYDIVPDSAPFSAEQRAWLNGFLAGILRTIDGQSPAGPSATLVAAASALLPVPTVSEADANATVPAPALPNIDDHPWHDPSLSVSERMSLAEKRPLPQRMMAALAQLDCGTCGYVCKSYAEAIVSGSEKNMTLCSPGGSETAKLLRQLSKERQNPATPIASPTGSAAQPVAGRLVSSIKLNREGSAKDTRHVAIDIAGTHLKYCVGDALGVLPTNCDHLIENVCKAAHLSGDDVVQDGGTTVNLRQALAKRCLRTLSAELCERAQKRVTERQSVNGTAALDAQLVERLEEFADSDEFFQWDVSEFLENFGPLSLTAQDLIDTLPMLRPRLYSIASSQSRFPNEVHLTVSRVEDVIRDRKRKGVASTMLADRVECGSELSLFVQPHHGFTVPKDPNASMIMVGPGTGIAPFIAFLQQREADKAPGKNWLFFGDQKREHDFLYEEQLTQWQADGLLTRLDLAFSRDGVDKVYVQQRMQENGADLYQWISAGSYFYICGDAKRMARDVEQALQEIIAKHGQMSPLAAKEIIRELKQEKRYVCDVY